MADFQFEASVRKEFGKGFARRARMAGQVPVVIYANGKTPVHITLPAHDVTQAIRLPNALFEVTADGKKYNALVSDVQRDFVTRGLEHLDLLEVADGQTVIVPVALKVEGEPKPGCFATTSVKAVHIEVVATAIPRFVVLDITDSEAGAHFLFSDVQLPEGASLAEKDRVITAVKERAAKTAKQIDAPGDDSASAEESTDTEE